MSVFGISMVKNEVDIVGITVRHMLNEVDYVIVCDNGSSDGTYELLLSIAQECERLTVIQRFGFTQSETMTELAQIAGSCGGEWVVPFDADEIWFSPEGQLRHLLYGVPPIVGVVKAQLWNHLSTGRDDLNESDPTKRMRWKESEPGALPKIACRIRPDLVIHEGNHGANYEFLPHMEPYPIEIRHFPYRTPEQMLRKVVNGSKALLDAGRDPDVGGHWHNYANIVKRNGENGLYEWYYKWFYRQDPVAAEMVEDPAPVNRKEVR